MDFDSENIFTKDPIDLGGTRFTQQNPVLGVE